MYDLVVIGGGMGGLVAAALGQRAGLRTVLLEAHTRLGGCAGWFDRGPFTFDAGATALMGLNPGEVLGDLIELLAVTFETVSPAGYRIHLPDGMFDLPTDPREFEEVSASIPGDDAGLTEARRRFWRLQQAVGGRLFRAASALPRLPWRGLRDVWHDLGILGAGGMLAASTSLLTVRDVFRLLGLRRDRSFQALIEMLLQDTAQAGPETVPFANAAACLQAYRLGMGRPRGGMRRLTEGLGQRFAALGGDLRTATLVDRVEGLGPAFEVVTRRRDRLRARQVAFNVPLDLAAHLLGRSLEGRLARAERRSRARWSAFTGYLAIDRAAVPDDTPLFHQVLGDYERPIHDGNNVLISLSPCDDDGYGPADVRVATMSTHTDPCDWEPLDRLAHDARKEDYRGRLLAALGRALPDAPEALRHAEFATPRSFRRYTRRTAGRVGGAPVSRSNANLMAVASDALGPGLWLVGDSVFPGQGTLATAISAVRVVERITGQSWAALKALQVRSGPGDPVPWDEATGGIHARRPAGSDIRQPQP